MFKNNIDQEGVKINDIMDAIDSLNHKSGINNRIVKDNHITDTNVSSIVKND